MERKKTVQVLLTAVNAKYIHSNPAVYSLKACAGEYESMVELAEFTINHSEDHIFGEIWRRGPRLLFFSCYIWNREIIVRTAENIRKVLPETVIWAGGPEVSWDAEQFLRENPWFDGVMAGEGERTFYRLLQYYLGGRGTLDEIPGIVYREGAEEIAETLRRDSYLNMDELPFFYGDPEQFENRILYYESSRGCPFSCSYCLSSLDKRVRFRSLALVKQELAFFLEKRVRQVKFVDRTFNCDHARTEEIWRFLIDHDNGVTNFHFEISADLLTREELALLARMRPGLVQLEIGVQTVNRETLRAIRRAGSFEKIAENVRQIARAGNVHQHLDLIAGLPYEDFESFGRSFDAVYRLHPQELQLGFLKVLRGSEIWRRAEEYGIVYRSGPPYEVLETRWISCGELLRLKELEEMLEVYYNSRQFDSTIRALEEAYGRPFLLYGALADFYRETEGGTAVRSYTRMQRLEKLREFVRWTLERMDGQSAACGTKPEMEAGNCGQDGRSAACRTKPEMEAGSCGQDEQSAACVPESETLARYDRLLIRDLYLRENAKTRPGWAEDQGRWKSEIAAFYQEEEKTGKYLPGYQGRSWKQLMKMTHLERLRGDLWLLFDYARRDPLTYAAHVQEVCLAGNAGAAPCDRRGT